MKKIIGNTVKALLLGLCGVLAMSFSFAPGGDCFEIFLNNKQVVKQCLYGDKEIHTISLQQVNSNDELKVFYSHCGKVGMGRTLAITDSKNNILRKWTFSDGTATSKFVTVKVKELMQLKSKNTTLQLVYSAKQLPEGMVIAKINTASASFASH